MLSVRLKENEMKEYGLGGLDWWSLVCIGFLTGVVSGFVVLTLLEVV